MGDLSQYPWRDGVYKASNCFFDSVRVSGAVGNASGMQWEIQGGDFGEADEEMKAETGEEKYNIQI